MEQTLTYKPQNVCSRGITIVYEDGIVKNVQFYSALVEGMKVEDVLQRLEGIRCGFKNTSCPDQLCKGIREAMEG